jgi:5'-nucleotidase
MRLLLSNDDGISAPGLSALRQRLAPDHDLVVVAPEHEHSGCSQSLTYRRPLRARRLEGAGLRYAVDGTPTDCVKLGLLELAEGAIDWVVSGINAGANTGVLVHYSGTVGAAKEAALMGRAAMAVSLCGFRELDYDRAAGVVAELLERLPRPQPGLLLNVNIPARGALGGYRVVPASQTPLADQYERRVDPRGEAYYWLSGDLHRDSERFDDCEAVRQGFVAVTSLGLDWSLEADLAGALEERVEGTT